MRSIAGAPTSSRTGDSNSIPRRDRFRSFTSMPPTRRAPCGPAGMRARGSRRRFSDGRNAWRTVRAIEPFERMLYPMMCVPRVSCATLALARAAPGPCAGNHASRRPVTAGRRLPGWRRTLLPSATSRGRRRAHTSLAALKREGMVARHPLADPHKARARLWRRRRAILRRGERRNGQDYCTGQDTNEHRNSHRVSLSRRQMGSGCCLLQSQEEGQPVLVAWRHEFRAFCWGF